MPTGYTAQLEKDWDVNKWLREDLVRGLGVCIMLRDYDNLTEAQILQKLEKNKNAPKSGDSYHRQSLADDTRDLKIAKNRTRKEWRAAYNADLKKLEESLAEHKKEIAKKRPKYLKAVQDLTDFYNLASTEGGKALAKFGLEQLKLVEDEFEVSKYYVESVENLKKQKLDEYIKIHLEHLEHGVKYHTENLQQEESRETERYDFYLGIIKDCNDILGQRKSK